MTDAAAPARRTTGSLLRYFAYLGSLGFGGPVALVGYMQRDLVERRRWFSREEYLKALALSQLAPGPLAAQLAICLGFIHSRVRGATLVGLTFILPSFLMTVAIGWFYVRYGGLPWMQAVFYGVNAAVIAIIVRAGSKLARFTLGRERLLWAVFVLMTVVTAWTESEIPTLFVLCGVAILVVQAPPAFLRKAPSACVGVAAPALLAELLWFFAKAGAFVFGSGLAIVPFLYGGVVQQHHWLTERQFIDAVAVSMITPGPVVITVAFIGYLVAGLAGATLAAIGVFLPVYLITVLLARRFHRLAKNQQVKAFVDGVTAAATGAIAGAAVILGRRALMDVPTILMALVTLALLLGPKKIPEPLLILAAGIVGLVLKGMW